ncbi:glycosyltransferase family 57 protein [Ephemerocybe angulata]|uniref:Alpha-1,3-glucosyltransferase n=1 Tax=Ephemerocybe angulata TaxID=980116 RepID=A0A8H6M7G3_9AGAR|nr:glycosyltransferase family 57 protein [Tulosesus angulatus]
MDGLAALPSEGAIHKRASRKRTSSLASNDRSASSPPLPALHHWLGTPPLSASSSRDLAPNSSLPSSTSAVTSKNLAPGSPNAHRRSFSALYLRESTPGRKSLRNRQASNASIASTYTNHGGGENLHKSLLRSKRSQAHQEHAENGSMGRRWIRYMHKRGLKSWVVPSAVAFATLLKLALGVGSYSGQATPPMYGDYEAQRHWMEITKHLPFREWYTYDLQYWGLDYPPLTAYVSWICGYIGALINPAWFALDSSRGIETAGSKLYMRLTVVFFDLLVYVPAIIMFVKVWQGTRSKRTQEQAILLLLLQPALLLIDHGHFQYNSVMLGLTLLAVNFFATGNDLLGALCFVLSLAFKQMALYYAPAIGSYLLAKCIYLGQRHGTTLFTRLGLTVTAAFALLFLPFYVPPFAPGPLHILHPITRIFPFSRGLFEDKVANFWCASNVLVKWRRVAGEGETGRRWLVRTSTALTALGFGPAVAGLLRAGWTTRIKDHTPNTKIQAKAKADGSETTLASNPPPFLPLLSYALLASSMSFFLFSFQVHEKTILLPLLPLTLLMSAAPPGSALHNWGALGNNVAVFSMWPLLKRDGLAVPYVACVVLWNRVIGYDLVGCWEGGVVQVLSLAVYAAALALHALELVFPAPARYPDLFPVLNVLISTPVFVLIWLWSLKCGVEVAWALGGLGGSSKDRAGSPAAVEGKGAVDVEGAGTAVEGGAGARRRRVEGTGGYFD